MEKRIIFATGNEGKMREIRMILGDLGVPVVSMKEAGAAADIEENGTSFEENAIIKARTIMKKTGEITMADDSGLEIRRTWRGAGYLLSALYGRRYFL